MPQPNKGPRKLIAARAPLPFVAIVEKNAAALHMTTNDYVLTLLAKQLGVPQYAPKPAHRQEQLDMTEGANTAAA